MTLFRKAAESWVKAKERCFERWEEGLDVECLNKDHENFGADLFSECSRDDCPKLRYWVRRLTEERDSR